MNNLELADKLQNAASNHYGDLCGILWDAGEALRNLHTENMALRCTEMALRDELEALKWALSEAEPVAWLDDSGNAFPIGARRGAESWVSEHQRKWEPLYTLKGIK